jgi:hypothetical protein
MPQKRSRGHRREKRTNVYVQRERPRGREAIVEAPELEDEVVVEAATASAPARSNTQARVARTRRLSRQNVARAEIFTRSVPRELRKFGVLAGGMGVVLVVLTFVLG